MSTVSNAAIKDLVDTCLGLGELLPSTLVELGLQIDTLSDPHLRCSETILIDLWKWLESHSQRLGLGLEIGSFINPSTKGLLASWVSQANTLGEALAIFRENIALMNPSETWEVYFEEEHCILQFSFASGKGYPVMAIERSLSALVTWGRALSGVLFEVQRADFTFTRSNYIDLYFPLFGHDLNFEALNNQLIITRKTLDLPILNSNEFLKSMMAKVAGKLYQTIEVNVSLKERVLVEIEKVYESDLEISVDNICNSLLISRQTLFRKLKNEKCNFKELSDQFKKERALILLQSPKHNITSVALSLGYKDSSSFTKAFKRWYGSTPKDYLKRQML